MKRLLFFGMFLWPVLAYTQEQDTTKVLREIDSLIYYNASLTDSQKFEGALKLIEEAKRKAEAFFGKDSYAYGKCLFGEGRTWIYMGNYQASLTCYQELLPIVEKKRGKENAEYAQSLHNLAMSYNYLGQYPEALKYYSEARDIRKRTLGEVNPDYLWSLHSLAIVHQNMGSYEEAESLLTESLAIRKETVGENNKDYLDNLQALALLYNEIGQNDKAESSLLLVKKTWEKNFSIKDPGYAWILNNLAGFYFQRGQYFQAEPLYLDAKNIWEDIFGTDHHYNAQGIANLAMVYHRLGQKDLAEKLYKEAEPIIKDALGEGHPNYATMLNSLGTFYLDYGQEERALPFFQKAKDIRGKTLGPQHPLYASSLDNLAQLHFKLGDPVKAELLFKEAMNIREKALGTDHLEYAMSLNNLGEFYYGQGDYQKAEQFLLAAIQVREQQLGKVNNFYLTSLNNLFRVYRASGSLQPAFTASLESSTLNRELISKSLLYLTEKEVNDYVHQFTNVIGLFFSFNQSHARDSSAIMNFDNILFYKGFLLNSSKHLKNLASGNAATLEKYALLKSYHYLLAKAYAKPIAERENVAEWEAKANELEKELIQTVAGFGEALRQVSWQDVQATLQPGEVAIEFIDYRFHDPEPTDRIFYSALILRPGDEAPQFVPLFEEKEIAQLLQVAKGRRFRHINNFYNFQHGAAGERLYQLIWEPLESHLSGIKKVYCSPSGLLHRINLGAVPLDEQNIFSDRYELVSLGSTRQLVIPSKTEASDKDALVLGGIQYETDTIAMARAPKMEIPLLETSLPDALNFKSNQIEKSRGETLTYLPNTYREAVEVNTLLRSHGYAIQLDTAYAATEEAFRQIGTVKPSPRVLHIATHGYFFPDPEVNEADGDVSAFQASSHPMIRSGLLLAGSKQAYTSGKGPDNREDGVLTAYEISQMDLSNTELVVLSACETGLGDIDGNEGVYGLQRAFKIAGAKYLIMSLWQVGDNSSRQLMVEFYRQWLENGLTIPEAFWAAQQHLRSQFPDSPFQWAGFVLVE